MIKELELEEFLQAPGVILDVRSPAEFAQGKIPGAYNLPLFSNQERAAVGTLYKQEGKASAVALGLQIVGPKLADLAERAKELVHDMPAKVHCWRGGMRSASTAWLLQTAGIPACTLKNGYKTFRRWSLNICSSIQNGPSVIILSGMTGSGKTRMLQTLQMLGEQILDLEGLSKHRGSSFGGFNMPKQPTNEQFENDIASLWATFDPLKPVWIEDESRMIGQCKIPDALFAKMKTSPLMTVEKPLEERVELLCLEYAATDSEELICATQKIKSRLGLNKASAAIDEIRRGNKKTAVEIILDYYDRAYQHAFAKRNCRVKILKASNLSDAQWAQWLKETIKELT